MLAVVPLIVLTKGGIQTVTNRAYAAPYLSVWLNTRLSMTTPFLKWPGGKRWFIYNHARFLPKTYKRYIEPFLGAGSVFFHLKPQQALLGDINEELINAYEIMKNNWVELEDILRKHQENHGVRYYYRVRDMGPRTAATRAARLIYLNRTCFNGIYRVNLEGKFNVPKGTKATVLFEDDDFVQLARLLTNAELRSADFQMLIEEAKKGDFVFADPPYTVRHNLNGFIKYNEKLFSWHDQIRLADALAAARDRGSKIVSTNANHKSVRDLYKDRGFSQRAISRFSSISADADKRTNFEELVILST